MDTGRRIRLLAVVGADFVPAYVRQTGPAYDIFTGDARWFQDNIPCQAACPAHTDVPRYIALIADGRDSDSYEVNREANVFPACLGRICAHPCEDACRRRHVDAPVSICSLKRVAADYGGGARAEVIPPPTGKRVAIVGAGASGLAAARELARAGHDVTVFERYPVPGGMLWAGVPEWRLPREAILAEVGAITDLGVEIRYNVEVGRDILLEDLADRFDAVLLAAGCQDTVALGIPGEDLDGVTGGLRFLEHVNLSESAGMLAGERVVTIGGGYTSIDCVRSALRLGARQSTLAYRRGRRDIPVGKEELDEAEREGVDFLFLVTPVRITGENGRVTGVEFQRNRVGEPDERGRRVLQPEPGSEFVVPCDRVIVAIGQQPDHALGRTGVFRHLDRRGVPTVDEHFRTDHPRIWATGDYVARPRNFISAIADGKRAASSINAALAADPGPKSTERMEFTCVSTPEPSLIDRLLAEGVADWTLSTVHRRLRRRDPYNGIPRQVIPLLPLADRGIGEAEAPAREVELGFTPGIGAAEAQRCLQCQLNIFIDGTRCILCNGCVEACPYGCIEMVAMDRIAAIDGDAALARSAGEELGSATVAMVIDEERCIRCGACVDRCPTGCLTMDHFRLVPDAD